MAVESSVFSSSKTWKRSITIILGSRDMAQWGTRNSLRVFIQLIDYLGRGDHEDNKSYVQEHEVLRKLVLRALPLKDTPTMVMLTDDLFRMSSKAACCSSHVAPNKMRSYIYETMYLLWPFPQGRWLVLDPWLWRLVWTVILIGSKLPGKKSQWGIVYMELACRHICGGIDLINSLTEVNPLTDVFTLLHCA